MTIIIIQVLAVMTVREWGEMISPEEGEQSAYRFISLKGSENVKGHRVSDGG